MSRLTWCVAGLVAGIGVLWALSPQDCVVLGDPTARPPCPARFGFYVSYPLLWSLAVATTAGVTIAGLVRAKRKPSKESAR
jgi:hypothetical protein